MNTKHIKDPIELWTGEPVFHSPGRDSDDSWIVFAAEQAGKPIARFYGDNAREHAELFCSLFGVPSLDPKFPSKAKS